VTDAVTVRRDRRDRAIQSPLGNPAPGADSIGNHFDGERRFVVGRQPEVIRRGGGTPVDAANSTFQNLAHASLHSAV
jgi:hypothetical protein